MTDITMPKLSDSMEEGLVLQWLIEDGQPVSKGDELVEIETDKATMTYEAEADGELTIVVPEGTTVAVGTVIARVGARSEATAPKRPNVPPIGGHEGRFTSSAEPQAVAEPEPVADSGARAATPVARRIAGLHGIALAELTGTGPGGRITKRDVLGAAGGESNGGTAAGVPAPAGVSADGGVQELTRLQQVVARRMAESKATIPHFQVQTEVAMDAAIALRRDLTAAIGADEPAPSYNDLVVKACALALRRHPHANGSYKDGRFELHDRVNVGVAVAREGALVVPTLFDADAKSLGEIAREARRLAERVRSNEITPPELSGATFTVSNLGMYGMTAITPVINPPQAAILGVGAIRETLTRQDGEIVDRSLMTVTLSCDHRILYGADASLFLAEVKDLLEAPLKLVL